jgi:hypothetical protein
VSKEGGSQKGLQTKWTYGVVILQAGVSFVVAY